MDKKKIMSMIVILAAIVVIAGSLTRLSVNDSLTLAEYASMNAEASGQSTDGGQQGTPTAPSGQSTDDRKQDTSATDTAKNSPSPTASPDPEEHPSPVPEENQASPMPETLLTGASLNGDSMLEQRTELTDGFYYEPISDRLRRYMTGVSFPSAEGDDETAPAVTFEELRYIHILHYDFDGMPAEGELVCNEYIAQDLLEIFYELYRNEYQLEKVLLIDEYNGDDTASMEDNNTSCFNYRPVAGSASLSKHALGLAVDINPLYNPYITYTADGEENVSPASALPYADRSGGFPYKIDADDLCCKLFLQHGFTWGGNWNNVKDYQHFQKTRP